MKFSKLLYLPLFVFAVNAHAVNYDVHARDMTFTGKYSFLNKLGHLGMEYNNYVYNMLPYKSKQLTINRKHNFLHAVSIPFFQNAGDHFWGVKYSKNINNGAYNNIYSTYVYGADYTKYASFRRASMTIDSRTGKRTYKKGLYRCDAFVKDSLERGGFKHHLITTPAAVYNRLPEQRI